MLTLSFQGATVYTALASKDASNLGKSASFSMVNVFPLANKTFTVHIFRAGLSIVRGISSDRFVESAVLDLGASKLIDLGFMGSRDLLLLCADHGKHGNTLPPPSCYHMLSG